MARAFGIRTPSVVLWPLGGAAMTEHEAEKPIGDLLIAAAGPLVNLIFGGLLFLLVLATGAGGALGASFPFPDVFPRRSLAFLAVTNVILGLTNLIPIYPLDGGRIFRAAVHMIFGPVRSNLATFWLSLALGVVLLAGALFTRSWLLAFTAVLLLAGAMTLNQPFLAGLLRFYARLTRRPEVYLRLADFDPALELITRRIEVYPRDPVLYLQRGYIYFTMDDLLRAMADADRALNIDPNYLQAILLKGALHYALENPNGCWACIERAEMIRPDWSVTWLNRAILHRDEGNLETALADLQPGFRSDCPRAESAPDCSSSTWCTARFSTGRARRSRPAPLGNKLTISAPKDAVMFPSDRQRIFAEDWAWVADYFAFLETKIPTCAADPGDARRNGSARRAVAAGGGRFHPRHDAANRDAGYLPLPRPGLRTFGQAGPGRARLPPGNRDHPARAHPPPGGGAPCRLMPAIRFSLTTLGIFTNRRITWTTDL